MEGRPGKPFDPKEIERLRKEVEDSMKRQRQELGVKPWPKSAHPRNNGRNISPERK